MAPPARKLPAGARMVHGVLEQTIRRHGDKPALCSRAGGAWRTISWTDYREQARLCARGLLALGLAPGGVVLLFGENRPEWILADVAAILAGGIPAGIYTSSTPEQCRFVAAHSEARIAVVDTVERLERLRAVRAGLPALSILVLIHGVDPSGEALSWSRLLELGAGHPEAALDARLAAQQPDDACTLIYTSGTTGSPKAVMLTHTNLTWTASLARSSVGFRAGDNVLSYLPLTHVAEQLSSIHMQMLLGGCTWFTESLERLGDDLRDVRPDYFLGVPRVWERIQAQIQAAGSRSGPLRSRLVRWARRQSIALGGARPRGWRARLGYLVADHLVFSKVRRRLGLDHSRYQVTSSAPTSRETLEFFLSLGIPLYELYGLSETTGPATVSAPGMFRTGSVGRVVDGTEIRIAPDGEVLICGPHIFKGYYKDPVATAEAIDEAGWLHTGDIGMLDGDGYLWIVDRKKDLIPCAGGEKVAPQPLEGRLRSLPAVAHAAVFGIDGGRLAALIALDPQRLADLRAASGSAAHDLGEAAACPKVRVLFRRLIDELAAVTPAAGHIGRFAVLPAELTIEGGELTPTLKVKRRVLREKYSDLIDEAPADATRRTA
jgi:long-subunit acyl-CoA synthetase (AMP-forming)